MSVRNVGFSFSLLFGDNIITIDNDKNTTDNDKNTTYNDKNTIDNDKNTTDDSISAMNDRRWDINISLPKIHLKSKTNAIFLNDDGSLYIEETKEHLCGHFIINISVFPKINMFGHYLTIFFNRDEKNLVIFNSCENENYG